MNIYTATFNGYYPVGASAVVVAVSAERAADLLAKHLITMGLPQAVDPKELKMLDTTRETVEIITDGNY